MKKMMCFLIGFMMLWMTLTAVAEEFDPSDYDTEALIYIRDMIEKEIAQRELVSEQDNQQRSIYSNAAYSYYVNEDGTVTLSGYSWNDHSNGDDLIVPSTIDGYSVSGIADKCYADHEKNVKVGTLVIPEGIVEVGSLAFYDLRINHISIPASATVIQEGAFASVFDTISVGSGNNLYTVVNNALYEKASKKLIAIAYMGAEILDGIESIGAYACYKVTGDKEHQFLIPDSVVSIGDYAFYGAELWTLDNTIRYIPAVHIGVSAFENAEFLFYDSLQENRYICFNKDLESISQRCFYNTSQGRHTYEKYFSTSAFDYRWRYKTYDEPLTLVLPSALKTIEESAFSADEYYDTDISLRNGFPIGLEVIGERAFGYQGIIDVNSSDMFGGCTSIKRIGVNAFAESTIHSDNRDTPITSVSLPETTTSLGSGALNFAGKDPHTVYIPGSVELIGNDAFNKSSATLYVTNGSYAAEWASSNAYRYTTGGDTDLSWLND